MAEKIIMVEPGGSSGKPGTGSADPVENSKPKNKVAMGVMTIKAANITHARVLHLG
jgi:hypothetical protein